MRNTQLELVISYLLVAIVQKTQSDDNTCRTSSKESCHLSALQLSVVVFNGLKAGIVSSRRGRRELQNDVKSCKTLLCATLRSNYMILEWQS